MDSSPDWPEAADTSGHMLLPTTSHHFGAGNETLDTLLLEFHIHWAKMMFSLYYKFAFCCPYI